VVHVALLTRDELRRGALRSTGSEHALAASIRRELRVRLDVDPADARTCNDRFTLRGSGPSGLRYEQVRTVRDDLVPGDHAVDLLFDGLVPDLSYSLEIDPGRQGKPYFAFEDVSWSRLALAVRQRAT